MLFGLCWSPYGDSLANHYRSERCEILDDCGLAKFVSYCSSSNMMRLNTGTFKNTVFHRQT